MAKKLPALDELLAYHNEQVVHYFSYHHPEYTKTEAEKLFKDLMGWLWLKAYRSANNRRTYLFGPLLPMDAMWHVFILHTKAYELFCQQFFAEFVHHDVEPPGQEYQLMPEEIEDFLNDCFQFLGQNWVLDYFATFLAEPVHETPHNAGTR